MKLMAPLFLLALSPTPALAFQSIFVVRHAEKLDSSRDPELSPKGKARAEALSKSLRDSGISAIYTTEYKRTILTAAPLAEALKIKPTVSKDMTKTLQALKADQSERSALVVGHSNTVPEVLKGLGSDMKVEISESEFDRLYIVTPQKSGKPIVSFIRYGSP